MTPYLIILNVLEDAGNKLGGIWIIVAIMRIPAVRRIESMISIDEF